MSQPVLKGTAYALVHVPDMVVDHGSTAREALELDPSSEFPREAYDHIPTYTQSLRYPPHQCYIGTLTPEELKAIPKPWYEQEIQEARRFGKYGEIMPQEEGIGLMKMADAFNLVLLETGFHQRVTEALRQHPVIHDEDLKLLGEGVPREEIQQRIAGERASPIVSGRELVGCVKRAHDHDPNLQAPILLENIVVKATGFLALKHLLAQHDFQDDSVDYIIETSEEACGDMNQRGGGNFAKAIGEMAGLKKATGSDVRAFCAAPAHGLVTAASLVKSGMFRNIVVLAGGSVAKLGMNARDHLKKGVPVLEHVLGSFAVLIGRDDGMNPVIRTDSIGYHSIGTGASPQAVTKALIADPLQGLNLKTRDVDKYSVEMQNPEITTAAGAGDVPLSNYKMIAALGVKKGELEKEDIMAFVETHGLVGWAPTQGHIPSGVPYLGFARENLIKGIMKRIMIIGKGSLFLGRLTGLFDGISFLIEGNPGFQEERQETVLEEEDLRSLVQEVLKSLGDSFLREGAGR